MNYPNDYAYTRVTEFKHLTGQKHPKTSIVYEYPRADGRPLLPGAAARERRALPQATRRWPRPPTDVPFVGRLATYKYYNMDQVVGQALAAFKRLKLRHRKVA